AQWNLGRVIGPALAGIVIAVGSYTWAFGINAASFGAVMIALLLVRFRPGARVREQGRLLARIVSGARAAAAEPGCRAAIVLIAVGAAYIGVLAGLNTVVQLRAPEALRGRILSLYMLALGVIYPIGAIIQGAIADRLGLRTVVVGTAVLLLAVLVAFYFR